MSVLNSKIPAGPLADKWKNHKNSIRLVNPANKRNIDVIVVGTGSREPRRKPLLFGRNGLQSKGFLLSNSPRRALDRRLRRSINAAKNYRNDGD